MFKYVLFLLPFFPLSNSFAAIIPDEVRKEYATKFHEAFVLQSTGATRRAYYSFKTAQQLAQKAGESSRKIQLLSDLFVWYRTYGYSMGVMSKQSGCVEEHRSYNIVSLPFISRLTLAKIPDYYSEWGNTPEQSAKIREFMLGVGETISGIFCVTVSGGVGAAVGMTLLVDGPRRMYLTLNDLWADHERSCIEFKQLNDRLGSRIGE